jgi:predicted extracellular nuclease
MRIGYSVPALAGVMHGWKNNYTVIPSNIVIDPTAPRTVEPVIAQDANLVIVGMNVLNYFNGDGLGEGFPTSRGAPSYEALIMQTDKIVSALTVMNADVIALMEIENDGFDENSAIQSLVTALNIMQSEGNEYTFINPGVSTIGTDEISVGLLYRNQKLQAIGSTAILDSSNSPLNENGEVLFVDTKNRPSLIQSFSFEGDTFTLSVNHLKSKGSACDEADEGLDGQGNCNQSRTNAAQALTEFLATNPTGIATDKVMILGDLNAYSQEDPMQLFYQNGFENLKYTDKATEEKPFSYSYSGFLGSLDHALSSSALTDNVLSVDAWHINSVEDSTMDYLTEENGQTYSSIDNYAAPDAYRSSDHDPIIVALNMGNSAPEFIQELPQISIARKRERINTDLSEFVMDSDNDELLYSSNSLPNGLTLSASGQLTGKLKAYISNSQPVQFDLVISDGKETIQSEVTIVLERADNPVRKFLNRLIGWFNTWFGR